MFIMEINQLLDQLEAATVALRRAVNARPAPEPKPVARVRMVRT